MEVQTQLRAWFTLFGLCETLRFDNGNPWHGRYALPSPLELWVVGLGVGVIFNPVGRPQDNGVIERSQRTAQGWAEPKRCASGAELQAGRAAGQPALLQPEPKRCASGAELQERLDEADRRQRECYPTKEKSRWTLFPGLHHSGRKYSRA